MLHSSRRSSNPRCFSTLASISVFFLALSLFTVLWLAAIIDKVNESAVAKNRFTLTASIKQKIIYTETQQFSPKQNISSQKEIKRQDFVRKVESKNVGRSVEIKEDTVFYGFNRKALEEYLAKNGPTKLRKIIGAFLEPETSFATPETINQGAIENDDDPGMPPKFITPLPLRTYTPDDLKHYEYPKFQTCHDLPAKLPVDRGLELDKNGEPIVWNIGDTETPPNYPWDEAPFCPVDADPFLPWIHDLFPSVDGTVLEFIAHNRRRCKTGRKNRKDVLRLEPQVALLQHVSVQRITQSQAVKLAPDLWNDDSASVGSDMPRYRLAPMNESSPDGRFTRFLCRFHGTTIQPNGEPQTVIINETLSIFPFNYEFVSYRLGMPTMLTPKGKNNKYYWTSVLRFQCPIPSSLQEIITSGYSILSDGTPTLHVDLIPIRTPPRFGVDDMYLTEEMIGPRSEWDNSDWNNWTSAFNKSRQGFDPYLNWGDKSVLPRVEASGRWTNLPICQVPSVPEAKSKLEELVPMKTSQMKFNTVGTPKPHLLSACLWAAASFKTRGEAKNPILDTSTRLKEWIEFHLMVGFDHIYVFDNSGEQSQDLSLKPVIDEFPSSRVSRVEWPFVVCNNNVPGHDSSGERSSQYAAENACRTRYSSFTEWLAVFDTDEYLIPQGNFTSLQDVLKEVSNETNILTFRSSRARLLYEGSS
jgi:Glycosyltransferase family 92